MGDRRARPCWRRELLGEAEPTGPGPHPPQCRSAGVHSYRSVAVGAGPRLRHADPARPGLRGQLQRPLLRLRALLPGPLRRLTQLRETDEAALPHALPHGRRPPPELHRPRGRRPRPRPAAPVHAGRRAGAGALAAALRQPCCCHGHRSLPAGGLPSGSGSEGGLRRGRCRGATLLPALLLPAWPLLPPHVAREPGARGAARAGGGEARV
mmetsp:Transcript_88289/g.258074  ORF Transcript_88289/g.258074 Transcript_88289/m.258074 type:complete len:210 (+) Transcript_88289:787-1416(+)